MLGTNQLVLVCRSHDGGLGEHFQQESAIEARLFTEGDSLGNRLHVQTEQGVDDQLHRGPGAARPEVEVLLRDGGKDRLAGVEYIRVAAAEENQTSLLSGGRTAGDGNIQN